MAVGKKEERHRLSGVAECVKLAMTTQFLPARRRSLERTTSPRGQSVGRLFRRLLSQQQVGVVAAHYIPSSSGTDGGTYEKGKVYRSKTQHSTASVTSSDASDSAIASRRDDTQCTETESDEESDQLSDDDSDVESVDWRGDSPCGAARAVELSMVNVEMEPCTFAEKVQRWKDTIGRSHTRSRGTERTLPPPPAQRAADAACYRDSLDSGLHSLSLSSWPASSTVDQLQCNAVQQGQTDLQTESKVQQHPPQQQQAQSQEIPCRKLGSPLSGHDAGADDTLTSASALSSLASDGEDVETANDDSRSSFDCCELDTADLKGTAASRSRSDVDSLLADRRTSRRGDSLCDADAGTGAEYGSGDVDGEFRFTSLPSANGQRTRLTDEEDTQEVERLMDAFVVKIFDDYASLSPEDKSRFGLLATRPEGRSAFARSLDGHRAGRACLTEGAFLSLAQSTAVMLFESCEAGDWSPAKVLMNMCFTFYTEELQADGSVRREHLYNQLSSQPIWKNTRFWDAAFFEAILCERAKFLLPSAPGPNCVGQPQYQDKLNRTGEGISETHQARERPDKESQRQCLENVTFSQLAAFTHNMHAFGLPAEMCLQFLEKQLVIGSLPSGQEQLLRENVESLYRLQPKKA